MVTQQSWQMYLFYLLLFVGLGVYVNDWFSKVQVK